jgi:O-antigen ligase
MKSAHINYPQAMSRATSTDRGVRITEAAFTLALALTAARCTMMENLRDPFEVVPGSTPFPHSPGPTVTVCLNLLCCVPALLVLIRRAIDPRYSLRWTWSHLLMLPLAVWMAASIGWSDDKFACLIASSTFIAALALIWAMTQLVRSWLRLRLVVALTVGLLAAFEAQGFYYKFFDAPRDAEMFKAQEDQRLREMGMVPGSFEAQQFEKKVLEGEMIGFSSSSNAFAGMLVLGMALAIGAAVQRIVDRDAPVWPIAIAILIPLGLWLLVYTQSKAAAATPILTALLLLFIWRFRGELAVRAKQAYWIGVALVVGAMAGVIGHGVFHGRLPTDSLNFRWRYWVACWRMFWRHPIIGVGWDNFYLHYLRDRLPVASEEIRDPHNFIIRFFVELGAVGGILMLAWMMRLWWEMTRPMVPDPPPILKSARGSAIPWVILVAVLAEAINCFAVIDFQQSQPFIILKLIERGGYTMAIVMGMCLVALQSAERSEADDRPAPWMLYGLLVGVGVFLIHNLIEFSLFENGGLTLFGLLVGTAIGVRQPNLAGQARHTASARGVLVLTTAAWIAAIALIFVPIYRAESWARVGESDLRGWKFEQSAADYDKAMKIFPINAEYAYRAGRALDDELETIRKAAPNAPISQILIHRIFQYYDAASLENPAYISAYLRRAALSTLMIQPNDAINNYVIVLQLDPNEVDIRLAYAKALKALGEPDRAREEFEKALWYNDQLDAAEPKRLTPEELADVQNQIGLLTATQP